MKYSHISFAESTISGISFAESLPYGRQVRFHELQH